MKLSALAALLAQSSLLDLENINIREFQKYDPKPLDKEEKHRKLVKYYQSKGLKPFNVDGNIIWARDRKNAERKFYKK